MLQTKIILIRVLHLQVLIGLRGHHTLRLDARPIPLLLLVILLLLKNVPEGYNADPVGIAGQELPFEPDSVPAVVDSNSLWLAVDPLPFVDLARGEGDFAFAVGEVLDPVPLVGGAVLVAVLSDSVSLALLGLACV